MSNISVDYDILNQKQTPAFYASSLATRPAFGFPGRIFIDTDTPSSGIYRDTGSAWVQVADPGAGTTGTLQQVTTNGNTTTLAIQVQGIDFSDGAGTGLYNIAIGNQTMGANTTGNNNIGIGYQNLKFNTTGALNVAVGNTALVNNTTGSQNTAVGQLALNLNTTGGQNTALGNATLQNNTTGVNNTAIGHASLNANTTADSNTAIGFQTLKANTTGANNTAIGQSSLTANTTGFSNVGIGSRALTANTTGAQNVAIGTDALYINTTGNTNTAIGTAALSLNITGGGNTAIGVSALNSNTTANYNTAVGGSSLTAITTGTLNTAIGYLSGSAITTGSNNSIIGAYAGTTTLASNIVLSDGAGNVRLFSDANGLIGINQAVGSVPGGQLDIHTTQTYALVLNGLSTSNAYTAFSNASVGKWRIGNTYNAGANTFDIYNLGTSSNALSINSTSNVVTLNSYPLIDGGSVLIKLGSNTSTSGYTGIGAVATGLTINLGAAGTTGSLLFNTGASYSYTFPAATGTLALTSDLGSYLPLAGGTLTGTLNGTSASFSGILTAGGGSAITINSSDIYTPNANSEDDLLVNRFGYNGGITQYRNFRVYDGKSNIIFRTFGSTANFAIGSNTDDTINKLQVTGSIKSTSSISMGGGVRQAMAAYGAQDGGSVNLATILPYLNFNGNFVSLQLQIVSTDGGSVNSSIYNCSRTSGTTWTSTLVSSSGSANILTLTFGGTTSSPTLTITASSLTLMTVLYSGIVR